MSMKPTAELSPTHYFWLQLATLGAGIGALALTHMITSGMDDSVAGASPATIIVLLVVISSSLVAVGRSAYVIVTAGFSDAYRVFRSRHLFTSGSLLSAVAATTTGWLVVHDPFDKLFAHGRITGEDIVDVGIAVAAFTCMVGAGVAFTGAWDRLHAERHWHRTLHL